MKRILLAGLLASHRAGTAPALAGQAPARPPRRTFRVSHRDRVYAAEQFSNTVSVTDPVDNKLLGVIRLGDPQPGNFSPLYRGQVLVHGMGFSPDHKTLAVVSIGSNSVTFIDTATNAVKHTTYVGRSPHEAFFTPDGKEVWVDRARRGLCRGARRQDLSRRRRASRCRTARACRSSRPTANTAMSAPPSIRRPMSSSRRRSPDRRPGEAGQPLLPEHRGDAGRQAGLVHAEGYRQDAGLRCPAALRPAQDASIPGRSPTTSTSPATPTAPSPMSRSAA